MDTYPLGQMWGGVRVYPPTANTTLSKAFEKFTATDDPNASLLTSMGYANGSFSSAIIVDYAKPQANPPVYNDILTLANQTIVDTTRITPLTGLANELEAGVVRGYRYEVKPLVEVIPANTQV